MQRLTNTGPFRDKKFVEARGGEEDSGVRARDPRSSWARRRPVNEARNSGPAAVQLAQRRGPGDATRIRAALGTGEEKLAVQWASSAVFAVANTQLRKNARGVVTNYVAWGRVCDIDAVRLDEDLLEKAKEQRDEAKRGMDRAIKSAYQHVVYLAAGDGGEGRVDKDLRFEQPNQSALDGTVVWAELAQKGKTFGAGEFDAKALVHNLAPNDFGRTLGELRDLFWSSPRLPLLPDGDGDLQRAIYEAVRTRLVKLVGADGQEVRITRAEDIAVGSSSLYLASAKVAETQAGQGATVPTNNVAGTTPSQSGSTTAAESSTSQVEVQVKFALNTSLSDSAKRSAVFDAVYCLQEKVDTVASHVQLSVSIVLPESEAKELIGHAKAAGATPTSTPI